MQTIQKECRKAFNELAAELGVPYKLIEDIYFNEFAFLVEKMAKGKDFEFDSYENVLLKFLGTFYANEKHLYTVKKIVDGKRDNQQIPPGE